MFQCLQEHLGEPNFSKDCLEQVEARAQRMQEDYRLDYGVSTQCKEDVPQFCAAEQVGRGLLARRLLPDVGLVIACVFCA